MSKDDYTAIGVGLAYVTLILSLLIATVWTGDWRFAGTAVLVALPAVLLNLDNRKKEP